MVIPVLIGAFRMVSKGLESELEKLEIKGRIETVQKKKIVEISQPTEKSLGDLRY